ncbi:MAG: glutathione-disulfide reductase [Burkholderiales bacterium]|nr:glutathione-disulfide reductase [Burkholderiales bacterium]
MSPQYDLFVIGAGSGGVRAARTAASYGARVAIAEAGPFGGTCVNVGCIPKKLFAYAAQFRDAFRDAADFGWRLAAPAFDWPTLRRNKDREIARLAGVYERLLAEAGVFIVRGRARLRDPHTVEVAGERYRARHILVATGSRPVKPPIPGAELGITSDDAFFLERLPARALVVGGGYVALEFASILNGLGVRTTLAYRGARLLRGFDAELGERIAAELAKKGIDVRLRANPARLDAGIEVAFEDGARERYDLVLFATGRRPNTGGLGLEAAGVALSAEGAVIVDRYSKSSVDSIHAIGDVTNRVNLTPVATAEAMWLARTLFRGEPTPVDHENVPTAVFADPNVACVGLAEEAARARFGAVDVYTASFRALRHTLGARDERVFLKLVVEPRTQRVVGAHMIGPEAGEVIQGIAIAVKAGLTKAQFDATIGIHPTVAEEFVTMRAKTR